MIRAKRKLGCLINEPVLLKCVLQNKYLTTKVHKVITGKKTEKLISTATMFFCFLFLLKKGLRKTSDLQIRR